MFLDLRVIRQTMCRDVLLLSQYKDYGEGDSLYISAIVDVVANWKFVPVLVSIFNTRLGTYFAADAESYA